MSDTHIPDGEQPIVRAETQPKMTVLENVVGAWPDLKQKQARGHVIHHTGEIQIGRLKGGTTHGYSSVSMRIDLPDGKVLIAETTMGLFLQAAAIIKAYELSDEARNALDEPIEKRRGLYLPGSEPNHNN